MNFLWKNTLCVIAGALLSSGIAGEIKLFAATSGIRLETPMTLKGVLPERWGGKGVVVKQNGSSFDLSLSGTDTYPGFALSPREGEFWDYSKWTRLLADVENLDPHGQANVHGRIYTISPDNKTKLSIYNTLTLNPGEKGTLKIPFSKVEEHSKVTLPKVKRGPDGVDMPPNIYSGRITSVSFYSQAPSMYARNGTAKLRISNIRFAAPYKGMEAPLDDPEKFFPFIDRFGQYVHKNWNKKIRTEDDMRKNLKQETVELDSTSPISSWNRFGGWKNGPQLKATGFFRTEKYNGKWWFVDPEGKLFLSNGINAVQFTNGAYTNKREHWFETKLSKPGFINFIQQNLKMKYGNPLSPQLYETALKRLDKWGINTLGAWSDRNLYQTKRMPYTLILNDWGRTAQLGSIRFYDAFDPEFANALEKQMKERFQWSINDPWCIGYFVNNELQYGSPTKFAEYILTEKKTSPGKIEFLRRLKGKYETIEKLNSAWNSAYASWNAFLESKTPGYKKLEDAAEKDLTEFNDALTGQFFKVCRTVVKRNAPNHLYLGSRLRGTVDMRKPGLLPIAAKYCDVISVNNYSNSIAHVTIPEGIPDVPFLIGEFSFQVLDRGMFGTLSPAGITQRDRAGAMMRFWQGLLANPNYIGAHWFCYRDQFLTGRADGENFSHGFVDVCDTPYPEMTRICRGISEHMYGYRLNGTLEKPFMKEDDI